MNPQINRAANSKRGLSLIELMALLAVFTLIFLLVVPLFSRPTRGPRIQCINNLKNVGLAVRIYAADNNDLFPGQGLATSTADLTIIKAVEIFRALSNELSTPKIVLCPSDNSVREATNWADFNPKSFSFFASLSASEKHLKCSSPEIVISPLTANRPAHCSLFPPTHLQTSPGPATAMAMVATTSPSPTVT